MKRYLIAIDLIRSGCQIRKPDRDGLTPLHHAAQNENYIGVKLLLDCDIYQKELHHPNECKFRSKMSSQMRSFISNYKYVSFYQICRPNHDISFYD